MSIRRLTCYVAACDACRDTLDARDEDYTPHFDTKDDALTYALDRGWRVDTDGALYCDRCLAIATCLAEGHDFTPWMPCACRGGHPDHALFGCGLLRYCQRRGCDHADAATLATLPTTDEPQPFGR